MPSEATPTAKGVVILGATSTVARAVALEFGRAGYHVVLGARDAEENEAVATDVRVRCDVAADALPFEAEDFDGHGAFFDACLERLGDRIEGLVVCFGYMEDQAKAQEDFAVARRMIDVNYTAAVSVLEIFAKHFEERGGGFLAVLSSVAGDRGKQSNYLYGSAKAGLSTYLEGLRNRLFRAKVAVITIKPGFMDTKMTFGMGLRGALSPEAAGKAIFQAIRKRKHVAYVPWPWRYIMLIIRHVPEMVFKRMKM